MAGLEAEILRALLPPLFDSRMPFIPPRAPDALVLSVARRHRLSPALAVSTDTARLSPALVDIFQQDRLVTLGRTTMLRRALVETLYALDAAGVRTVVLKGLAYEQQFYPVVGTRPATDVDLLVEPPSRPAAFAVFRALGFVPAAGGPGFDEPDYHEVTFRRGDVFVDLHQGLAPFVRGAVDYMALWRDIIPLPIDGAPGYSLSRAHATVNQTLHMALHHFDVPALYLLDLARMLADPLVGPHAAEAARRWRCLRPWQTSIALMTAFIPGSGPGLTEGAVAPWTRRVISDFGLATALPRAEQLRRKVEHFDTVTDAVRYLMVQGRRVLRERWLAAGGAPTAAQRLGWPPEGGPS
ncbi:MAG: nucleotidyltransferase family protein [Polyangia bacterium]